MEKELISVIVPIYKVEKWLDSCIYSIREQTYQNLQIILVDDGGRGVDRCPEICDWHAAQDSRILVIHKENGGRASARNAGLSVAEGSYIFWVDGDDMIVKNTISRAYYLIQKYSTDGVAFRYRNIEEEVSWSDISEQMTENLERNGEQVCSQMEILHKIWGTMEDKKISEVLWNKLYKKEIVDNIRFKDNFYEDAMWLPEVYLNSRTWCLCEESMYLYRTRKESAIHSAVYQRGWLDSVISTQYRKTVIKKTGDYELIQKATREYLKGCILHSMKIPSEWEDAAEIKKWLRDYFKAGYRRDFADLKNFDKMVFGLYYIFPAMFKKIFLIYTKYK